MSYTTQQSAGNQPAVEYDDSLKAERQEVVVRAPNGASGIPTSDSTLAARIGEVQASPTSNTLLDRLKQLLTGIILAAGENLIGLVGGSGDVIDVTLSLDTSAYADGDVLADTQVVTNALRKIDGTGILQSLQVIDEDDQKVAMDLLFFSANVALGTENAAPSISDANARNFLGRVRINAADYDDLGGVSVATKDGIGRFVKSVSGSRDIYVAAITRGGTPTYTATGVRLRIGLLWN